MWLALFAAKSSPVIPASFVLILSLSKDEDEGFARDWGRDSTTRPLVPNAFKRQ